MYNWTVKTGWARHSIFGLRHKWLDQVLMDPEGWHNHTVLGNRQVDSLKMWLKTCAIKDQSGYLTPLGKEFISRGSSYLPLWELLWVNVVFNFSTACWYISLEGKEWETTVLINLLQVAVPRLARRTISNAIMELAGLLEKTPIGTELGQGQVFKGRPRVIVRTGHNPSDAAILHSINLLFQQQHRKRLLWDNHFMWPWTVFRCSRKFVWGRLTSIEQEFFCFDEQGVAFNIEDEGGWKCGDIITTLL